MKKILVIENEVDDFDDIKSNLREWDIYPNDFSEIGSFDLKSISQFVLKALSENTDIVALIIDISLINYKDETGLELIKVIRNSNDDTLINKIIPIFCYSRHDDLKEAALKAGATNFFSKDSFTNTNDSRYLFLRQSLHALAFLYLDAIDYAQRLSNFDEIMEKLNESRVDNKLILNAVLQLLEFDDLDKLIESDETESELSQRLGEETLQDLKKVKLSEQDKERLENQLNDIADIIGTIPGLSPFAGILKGIRLLSKSLW